MTIPANTAAQKFVICRGEYSLLTKNTVSPLIITMNRPRVKISAGSERMIKIGFRNVFIKAKNKPAIRITLSSCLYEILFDKSEAAI
jgi:hypothetical protein